MPSLCCRLCGSGDQLHNLIAPCLCAKRDDTLLCHSRCLLQHIEHSLQHRIDTSEEEAATCPACGKPYQLKLRWRLHFTAYKALSAFSLDQYCHLLGLTLMLALLLLTAYFTLHPAHRATASFDASKQRPGSSAYGTWVVVIVLLVVVCCGAAVAQVLLRLRRHQIQAELADDGLV